MFDIWHKINEEGESAIPVAPSALSALEWCEVDSIACYDGEGEGAVPLSGDAAFGIVEKFLAELPIRERDNNGSMPGIWFERGIHDGWYDIDKSGRLIAMRILMLAARRKWVD